MTIFILIHSPLYLETGGGVENGTILLTDFFLKSGLNVFLLSRYPIDSARQCHFLEQTICFPESTDPNAEENKVFIRKLAEQYPQAIVWDRGGGLVNYLSVCATHTSWRTLTSLHCNILSMFDCFTQRIEEAPYKKQLIRYMFYPVYAIRYYWQYIQKLNCVSQNSQYCILLVPALIEKLKRVLTKKPACKFGAIADPLKYPIASENILETKEKRIVLCSRLEHTSKRIDYFLRVWKRIQKNFPDWEVSIVGGSGGNVHDWVQKREMSHLKSLCRKWNLERIVFHDYQAPAPYYEKSAVYALTSRHEGFPNTLQEAQAFGCAVICFDAFPSASVLIKDGINGYLAKAFSIRDYAEKLSCMMQNERLRLSMGRASLKNAENYTMEKIGKQWLALFQEMLKNT